jgi:hypothetical protein
MFTVIGSVGAFLILFGFYRITVGKWTGKSFLYELDNFCGASLLAIYQVHNKVYIPVVINVVWAIVAVRGMSSYAERHLKKRK